MPKYVITLDWGGPPDDRQQGVNVEIRRYDKRPMSGDDSELLNRILNFDGVDMIEATLDNGDLAILTPNPPGEPQ